MSLVRLSGPPEVVVSLAELKAHLRLEDGDADQDALIAGYARAAQDSIDGAAGWLGRAICTQQWRMTRDCFPWHGVIQIPLPPCQSVDALTYIDTDGNDQSILDYVTFGIGGATPARLSPAYGTHWPSTKGQGDAVAVTFTCGYGSWSDTPESVRAAVLLMTQGLYDGCTNEEAVMALLMPHRVW
jgi:uncharacterized phiE125 gp8 family phage protein